MRSFVLFFSSHSDLRKVLLVGRHLLRGLFVTPIGSSAIALRDGLFHHNRALALQQQTGHPRVNLLDGVVLRSRISECLRVLTAERPDERRQKPAHPPPTQGSRHNMQGEA